MYPQSWFKTLCGLGQHEMCRQQGKGFEELRKGEGQVTAWALMDQGQGEKESTSIDSCTSQPMGSYIVRRIKSLLNYIRKVTWFH